MEEGKVRAGKMTSNVCFVDKRDYDLIDILFTVNCVAFYADNSKQEINLQG
jgi:hypothetical protein